MELTTELVEEIRRARDGLDRGDARTNSRIDKVEASLNALLLKSNRPGAGRETADDEAAERKSAAALCVIKHALTIPKNDGNTEYEPTSAEIDAALNAKRGLRALFRHGDQNRLPLELRKSLTSFALGSNSFIAPPEMSDTILSCLVDDTDIAGLVNNVSTSSGSIKFFIDNVRMGDAAWACEASCFANNPMPDLNEGLGELEIKTEPLRFVVCAGSDLVQDASFNIEAWVLRKVSDGFRRTISNAIIVGDGVGKPLGLLHPLSGIPVCETAPSTPAGMFTWQDLIALKWQIPQQWHSGGRYLMNQASFALTLTMSDASGRPIMVSSPTEAGQFLLNGSPIVIASQMPDVQPGATPVLFANLQAAYTLAARRATTLQVDPYSGGWCLIFRAEARVGGAITCPGAARLLLIK